MAGLNHHSHPFDEGTLTKLDLYRRYVRAWLPVFLNSKFRPTKIQIFDFFAGPGYDKEGRSGSPVIAFQEIRSALSQSHLNNPEIDLYLNEMAPTKFASLERVCQEKEFEGVAHVHLERREFSDLFSVWKPCFEEMNTANLLFLDQNGLKQITQDVFKDITAAARTDFLFFISSSYAYRFKNDPQMIGPTPITEDDFVGVSMNHVHRKMCEAYRRLIRPGWKYYLAPFSIKKGGNVYGLIFGSGHPLGMDKFLRICWREDPLRGEANFDIDGERINTNSPSLFAQFDVPTKVSKFEDAVKDAVLSGRIRTNKDAYLFALTEGFMAAQVKDALKKLVKAKILPNQSFSISSETCLSKERVPIQIARFSTEHDNDCNL